MAGSQPGPLASAADAERDRLIAAAPMAWLLRNQRAWIYRRVESIVFADDRTLRRRMSVDFELPPSAAGLQVVPLLVLSKSDRIRAFDLRDEDGGALPALTSEQTERASVEALMDDARRVLGAAPDPGLRSVAAAVVAAPWTVGASFVKGFRDGELADWDIDGGPARAETGEARKQIDALRADEDFMGLLMFMALGVVLFTPNQTGRRARRVVKLAYDRSIPALAWSVRTAAQRLAIAFGWRVFKFKHPLDAASRCARYHVECEAPAEAEIVRARAVVFAIRDGREREVRLLDEDPDAFGRAHLRFDPPDPGDTVRLVVELRVQRSGFLRMAWSTCALAFALLVAGFLRLDEVAGDVQSAAALLLVVPLVLAGFVERPGEHPFVSGLLVGVRVMTVLAAVCCLAAAGVLLAKFCPATRDVAWLLLTVIAFVCLAGVWASNLLPVGADKR